MLNQNERRQLESIERWFEASDPTFANALRDGVPPTPWFARRWLLLVLCSLGATLLTFGIAVISLVTFLIGLMLVAGALALRWRYHHSDPGIW
ncbi:MAG TPA: DUF3040 domain-containing protein [Pseudonocardiaceae bacterium]